jgi:hypothetical protein
MSLSGGWTSQAGSGQCVQGAFTGIAPPLGMAALIVRFGRAGSGRNGAAFHPLCYQEKEEVSKKEGPVYYTARHLLQALENLDEGLLDLPLVLVHGKELTKPNLVSGIIPSPIPVDRTVVEEKNPSLLALADLR